MDKIIVGRDYIAEVLQLNEKYINELENTQGLPKDAYNQYSLVDVIQWFIVYKENIAEKRIADARKEKPQDDLARESAMAKKISNMKELGYLIPAGEFERVLREEKNLFVRSIENLPTRIFIKIKKLLQDNEQSKALQLIEDECNELRERVSEIPVVDGGYASSTVAGDERD